MWLGFKLNETEMELETETPSFLCVNVSSCFVGMLASLFCLTEASFLHVARNLNTECCTFYVLWLQSPREPNHFWGQGLLTALDLYAPPPT